MQHSQRAGGSAAGSSTPRTARRIFVGLVSTVVALSGLGSVPAYAATVTSASFSGGTGTVTQGGVLYAKQGQNLTLNVVTSSDTRCVDVTGAFTDSQTNPSGKQNWAFSFKALAGDGVQSVTVTASPGVNPQGKCTGTSGSDTATYTRDNTGPVVTGALTPAPNAAGWNNSNVAIAWSATDAGVGVGSGPTPATDSVNQNTTTAGAAKTASATDKLGNASTGSVTVKLDKGAPTITGSRTPAANGAGWNNTDVIASFTCNDALSGIKSCTGPTTVSSNGSNQSVTGTAVDTADNSSSATVGGINVDKVAPALSGTPTTSPNGNGWYKDDVTIAWTASDALSGIAGSTPANSTIGGQGEGLTATASVSDRAGNTTQSSSAPVRIDRTAPVTGISGGTNAWTNGDVTVSLTPSDNLSGIGSTTYAVDGGAPRQGTSFSLSDEGDHTVTYFSTDKAGNVEAARTAHVMIDKSAPSITHAFTKPDGYTGGWTDQNVTVTFTCSDSGSGVADCTNPVTVTDEGAGQQVVGTAKDNAGNSASNTATVNIDKTPPTINGSADRTPDSGDWYNDDVVVSFTGDDKLSGLESVTGPTTLGEGDGQEVTGQARDKAGNTASTTVSGIKVDKTGPVLTASYEKGWHTDDVIVTWTCTDALSGVATGPADDTVTGEGDTLTSSATCTDVAGNTASDTVTGIKIDRHGPSTTASVPDPLDSGWYGGPVDITLDAADPISGVARTLYKVDGGDAQEYKGPFTFADKGEHTITYWSVDNAGNVEDGTNNTLTLKIDGIPPTTTLIEPSSPTSGWFTESGITFAFSVEENESGVEGTYYKVDDSETQTYGGAPFTKTLGEGAHTIRYWSVDLAGNVEDAQSHTVYIDTVDPTIEGSQSPAANGYGWNNEPVSVTFDCADSGSGIADCTDDTLLANDTTEDGVSVTGTATDNAGRIASATYGPVRIDTAKPTLDGQLDRPANGAGWYNHDVVVTWVGHDALSGIDPTSQPEPSRITGEGDDLGAGPATIKDKAGNLSDEATVSGIKIDRTAPTIAGAAKGEPNGAGWYKDAVTVGFACTDNLSGVASCPTDEVISHDGAGQSVTSGSALDTAGNEAAGITVGGINVDGTAPTTTADNQCTKVNGWCTGSTANVVLTATDQDKLSGVEEIRYQVDGGSVQVATGDRANVSVPLDGSGKATISYWAVDKAGNVEKANSAGLQWDNIAPAMTHTLTPAANADGWNNSDVTVHFSAKDNDSGSGLDADSVTADVLVSEETPGRTITGSAKDLAGNAGSDKVTVKLDKTKPTIAAAVTKGQAGDNGWYVGPVTVTFTCSDELSGVATCPDPVVLSANGDNEASGTATDKAGNSASTTLSGIKIDQEGPTVTSVNVDGKTYTLGAVDKPTCTATDSLSGPASCTVTVTGGNANGVGTFTWTATAKDNAGNTSTKTGTYKVIYRWDGFLQPINDTAHQVGTSTSIFKANSTVPVKFVLKRADGSVVQSAAAPVWLNPVKGSAMTAPVDETAYSGTADSGSTYRWDSTERQYIYNWKTDAKSAGNYWRIGVKFDDGQTYYVNIGLR